MKKIACWIVLMAVGVPMAFAQRNVMEDPSADTAIFHSMDLPNVQVGMVYTHLSRPVKLGNLEDTLGGDIIDVAFGISPLPWLLLYGQAGVSKSSLDVMRDDTSFGGGGLLGARVNIWQLYEGVQETAWRVTLQAAAQYAYRTSQDHGDGDLRWGESLIMLPLRYHLSFARSYRNSFMAEFQGFSVYLGPAYSSMDGTWTRHEVEQDFEESESFGVVGGADLWLLENLSFGARADWFDGTSMQLNVSYRF